MLALFIATLVVAACTWGCDGERPPSSPVQVLARSANAHQPPTPSSSSPTAEPKPGVRDYEGRYRTPTANVSYELVIDGNMQFLWRFHSHFGSEMPHEARGRVIVGDGTALRLETTRNPHELKVPEQLHVRQRSERLVLVPHKHLAGYDDGKLESSGLVKLKPGEHPLLSTQETRVK